MACVELVSKLKTEGATLAPAPRTLQEMKPRFTRPRLFLCLADTRFLIIRIILDGLETDVQPRGLLRTAHSTNFPAEKRI